MTNGDRFATGNSRPLPLFLTIEVTDRMGDIAFQRHMYPLVLRQGDFIPPFILLVCKQAEIQSRLPRGSVHIENVSYLYVVLISGWRCLFPSKPHTEGEAFHTLCDVKWTWHRIRRGIPEDNMIICCATNTNSYWTLHNPRFARNYSFGIMNRRLQPTGFQCHIIRCVVGV